MSTRVREAGADDAVELAALITLAYRVEDFFIDGDRTDAADVLARMERGRFLILQDERSLAGAVCVEARGKTGYFGMLSIAPNRQRQGLGAQLVAAAEAWCRDAGCSSVEIEVVNLRTELPPFYARLGYVPRETRAFPDAGKSKLPCHFIVMWKPLGPATSSRTG